MELVDLCSGETSQRKNKEKEIPRKSGVESSDMITAWRNVGPLHADLPK